MSRWYFNKNLKPQGPLSLEEMKQKIRRGEIGPRDLVHQEDREEWLAACEWREFPRDLFPAFQKNLFHAISDTEAIWTVLAMKAEAIAPTQEGPYSLNEIRDLVAVGELTVEDYIWRTGLSGWLQIKDRPDLLPREAKSEL